MDITELAKRIYSIDVYGMDDSDATIEDIANQIKSNPLETINYLLDIIDELQT